MNKLNEPLIKRDNFGRITEIRGFFGEYRWLSNFWVCLVPYGNFTFLSSEAAFQSAKCINLLDAREFISLSASAAKSLGRKIVIRSDWDIVKDNVMYEVLKSKFTANLDLREKLLDTGESYLEELNDWRDTYWGVCNNQGLNKLGEILMRVRADLRLNV